MRLIIAQKAGKIAWNYKDYAKGTSFGTLAENEKWVPILNKDRPEYVQVGLSKEFYPGQSSLDCNCKHDGSDIVVTVEDYCFAQYNKKSWK